MNGKRIKATAAFFFTALASFMMLTGSVLPHHHHGKAVCMDISHCLDHGAAVPGSDYHEQDGCTHTDTEVHCILSVTYYLQQQGDEQIEFAAAHQAGNDIQPSFAYFILPYTYAAPMPSHTGNGYFFAAIYVRSHQDFIAQVSGLRAPPFFIA